MDTPAPPPFDPTNARAARADRRDAPRVAAAPDELGTARTVPPATRPRAGMDPRRLALIAGALALLLVVVALATRDRSGVGAARHDLQASAEAVRDRERDVAKAQQELEERLADLQAARAQAQANAVKLSAEASKERRDARDTMVVGGDVTDEGDAERNARQALERSREAARP